MAADETDVPGGEGRRKGITARVVDVVMVLVAIVVWGCIIVGTGGLLLLYWSGGMGGG